MKSEDIGRQVRTGCLRTIDVMEMSIFNNHHGVVPRRQLWTVPGHHGPSQATGTYDSRQEVVMGLSRATSFRVRNKKNELQVLMKQRNIDECCIQETHLNSRHRFSIRGYETFRKNRKDRLKGGILTLVKNTHAAAEVCRPEDEDTEVLGIMLLLDKYPLPINNLCSLSNKQLRPQVFLPDPDRWIIMGDYDDLDHKEMK